MGLIVVKGVSDLSLLGFLDFLVELEEVIFSSLLYLDVRFFGLLVGLVKFINWLMSIGV